jgi:serine/threonine protein kinase
MPKDLRSKYYLMYELAEKGSLDTFWENDLGHERLSSFECRVRIAIEILTAIRFFHVGNVDINKCFHRDIKSANVVLKHDMTAQLIDCGLAKFVNDEDSVTSSTGIKGTPGYVCPKYSRGSIPYDESCDIFSFGVVLAELWSGRLQNYKDGAGSKYNFFDHYVDDEDKDMLEDLDLAIDMGPEDCVSDYMLEFKNLALACISKNPKKRPSGENVMRTLQQVWRACVTETKADDDLRSSAEQEEITEVNMAMDSLRIDAGTSDTTKCRLCRTYVAFVDGAECALCLLLQGQRNLQQAMFYVHSEQRKGFATTQAHLDKGLSATDAKLSKMIPVLLRLDVRLNNSVPRLFVLVPAELKNGWVHPRAWLHSKIQNKFCLYFVCSHSFRAVMPPIKLHVSKVWVEKIAPTLAVSLVLMQIAGKAVTGIDFQVDGMAKMMFKIGTDKIKLMLDEVKEILVEQNDRDLLERIQPGSKLSERDVQRLNGDAFELVVEKALDQREWYRSMKAVKRKGDVSTLWVLEEYANDPRNGYEIID